jgi:hypothetical protein
MLDIAAAILSLLWSAEPPERTMQVTITKIRGYAGANKRPTRGIATFSDGKTYEWSIHRLTGVPYFFTEKLNDALEREIVTFSSSKRAAALMAAIS